jgi:hypothetical protein
MNARDSPKTSKRLKTSIWKHAPISLVRYPLLVYLPSYAHMMCVCVAAEMARYQELHSDGGEEGPHKLELESILVSVEQLHAQVRPSTIPSAMSALVYLIYTCVRAGGG